MSEQCAILRYTAVVNTTVSVEVHLQLELDARCGGTSCWRLRASTLFFCRSIGGDVTYFRRVQHLQHALQHGVWWNC